jgi:hypothetical protein
MRRLIGILVACGLALSVGPGAALASQPASGPANDSSATPTVVTLPFSETIDTTNATSEAGDPSDCFGEGADGHSVWYTFTAPETGRLLALIKADFYSVVYVLDGSTSGPVIGCSDFAAVADITAGNTYAVMFGSFDGEAGGTAFVDLEIAPPPVELTISVNGTGSVNPKTGIATVSGVVTCSAPVDFGSVASANTVTPFDTTGGGIFVEVDQKVGRIATIRGFGNAGGLCSPDAPLHWSADVVPDSGKFAGGAATVFADANVCGPIDCSDASVGPAAIRLRGH